MTSLQLYSRQDCYLCEELALALDPIIRGRARLEIVDIDEDLDLKKRYGLRVPVLVGGGRELPTRPLDLAAIEAYLALANG
jgi:Glutaredoxin-like domain (DUF836)